MLIMIRGKLPCNSAGERQLVECMLMEADREGLYGTVGMTRHMGDDGARINPTAEECTNGNITDHVTSDGVVNLFAQLLDQFCLSRATIRLELDIPISRKAKRPVR